MLAQVYIFQVIAMVVGSPHLMLHMIIPYLGCYPTHEHSTPGKRLIIDISWHVEN